MTRDEFELIIKGSIKEAIDRVSLQTKVTLPSDNIKLVSGDNVLAKNIEQAVTFISENMYFSENEIKPCADLIVKSFTADYTVINLFIANYEPRPYCLNWAGGVGPFIKGVYQSLLDDCATNT